MVKVMLLVALMMFLPASCGGMKPVKFNPDFYEFVSSDGGYITDQHKTEKIFCDQPRARKEFAALHMNKIIELRRILRNAKVPDNFSSEKKNFLKTEKKRILSELQRMINISYK